MELNIKRKQQIFLNCQREWHNVSNDSYYTLLMELSEINSKNWNWTKTALDRLSIDSSQGSRSSIETLKKNSAIGV